MSSDPTIAILTTALLATIAAVVAVRLTFRKAASICEAVISPVVFAMFGALIAISVGMIWFADYQREGRVDIEIGFTEVVVGVCLGMWTGASAEKV